VISAPKRARRPGCAGPPRRRMPGPAHRPDPSWRPARRRPLRRQRPIARRCPDRGCAPTTVDRRGWQHPRATTGAEPQSPRHGNTGRAQSLRRTRPAERLHGHIGFHRHGEIIHHRIVSQGSGNPLPSCRGHQQPNLVGPDAYTQVSQDMALAVEKQRMAASPTPTPWTLAVVSRCKKPIRSAPVQRRIASPPRSTCATSSFRQDGSWVSGDTSRRIDYGPLLDCPRMVCGSMRLRPGQTRRPSTRSPT